MAGGSEQLSAHPSGRPEDAATGVEQRAGPRPPGVFRGAHRPTGATSLANLLARTGDDLRADTVLAMQRTAGNHAVTRALAPPIATTAMAVPAERSLQGLTPAHGPRGLGTSSVLARQGTKQIDKPGGEKAKGTASAAELAAESEMLALLEGKVTASDTAEQKRRVDRLGEIVAELPFWQAESIQARLSKPKPEDRLATEFKHRLSTETREVLLGRLSARVATKAQFFSPQQDPRKDPKYIDNVLEEVRCWLIVADRYTVVYAGGRKVVPNADIDWQKSSTALPIVTIQSDEAAARAAATEWHDVAAAGKYDRAVAFYHGPGGVVLPTWFSPETAPATYRLIMGVNASVRQEALSIAEEFRKLRNSMIIGAIAGGVLKFAVRMAPGGGGIRGGGGAPPSSDPIPDPLPESAGTTADPVGGTPKGGSSTTGNVKAPDVSTGSAPEVVEPAVPAKLGFRERLTKFYERLAGKPAATNAKDAMRQLSDTLDEVEDMYSGVAKKNPPPPPKDNDGRMYPPLEDFTVKNPDGSLSARTRAHRIEITPDGKITITSVRTGQVEFTKP